MLLKVDKIKKFGVFDGFEWDSDVRDAGNNIISFTKMNIFYARNYSGKTTFSRILHCLESKQKSPFYTSAECNYIFQDRAIKLDEISTSNKNVKVYNVDFIRKNLGWQSDSEGNIKPFSVVGEINVEIEEQLHFFENYLLDDINNPNCFQYYMEKSRTDFDQANKDYNEQERRIRNDLATYAANMKNKTDIYEVSVSFRQDNLDAKLKQIKDLFYVPYSEDIKAKKELIAKEVVREKIIFKSIEPLSCDFIEKEAIRLAEKIVRPSLIIERISSNVEGWVLQGLNLHKNNSLTNCGFCGSLLSNSLLLELDQYFNQEILDFQNEVKKFISKIDDQIILIKDIFRSLPDEKVFYSDLSENFKNKKQYTREKVVKYGLWLQEVRKILDLKSQNIFEQIKYDIEESPDDNFLINQLELIIENHNTRTEDFKSEVESNKKSLTNQAFFEFWINFNYSERNEKLKELLDDRIEKEKNVSNIKDIYHQFEEALSVLRRKKVSQESGIRYVNTYLTHFFAINHLRLDEFDNGTSFKVLRNGELAHHLSEGECSLISFCYFMAKLKELESLEDVIIWIDDPISSLDSNHIFYIFSLIESEIAKPIITPNQPKKYKYKQLFISTHNLDFLKYLHRISQPVIKKDQLIQSCIHSPPCVKKIDSNECSFFILERTGNNSAIKPMPKYMRNFSTEYNYLFSKILKLASTSISELNEDFVYNFGNNLRKFLEAHLYFKFPTNKISDEEKLKLFIKDPNVAIVCQRMTNEMSHLEECFDRGILLLDLPESQKLAKAVLDILKASDNTQFEALVKSCN